MSEHRPRSEACARNREPILAVLRRYFATRRRVLEIGSGSAEHAEHFAAALPALTWQSSDVASHLPDLRQWIAMAGLANLPPPLALDVSGPWPEARFDALFTANTLHIMDWEHVRALFAALPAVLTPGALLAVYGPFNYDGRFTSPSNAAFDTWLKRRSPASGIRDFAAIDNLARASGLTLVEDGLMPANNRMLIWQSATTQAR
jgi:cyclopropane fatty-acyl-phospholipid synthase-like methyltransferase